MLGVMPHGCLLNPDEVVLESGLTVKQGRRWGYSVQGVKRWGIKKPTEVGLNKKGPDGG